MRVTKPVAHDAAYPSCDCWHQTHSLIITQANTDKLLKYVITNWVILLYLGVTSSKLTSKETFHKSLTETWNLSCVEYLGGGGLPEKVVLVWGMGISVGQDPFFVLLSLFFRSPIAAWFSSLDPTLSKNYKFWLLKEKFPPNSKNVQFCSLKIWPKFSSQALKILKIFSSLYLTFAEKYVL